MSAANPQVQVDAVLNVLAPYVDGPAGFQPQRWPIFRLDYDGQMVMPSDEQVRALAEQIVTAIRTASGWGVATLRHCPNCDIHYGEEASVDLADGTRVPICPLCSYGLERADWVKVESGAQS